MTAAADGHMDIVKMLLQHNANVALKDAQGWKASDHAVMNGIHRYHTLIQSKSLSSSRYRIHIGTSKVSEQFGKSMHHV